MSKLFIIFLFFLEILKPIGKQFIYLVFSFQTNIAIKEALEIGENIFYTSIEHEYTISKDFNWLEYSINSHQSYPKSILPYSESELLSNLYIKCSDCIVEDLKLTRTTDYYLVRIYLSSESNTFDLDVYFFNKRLNKDKIKINYIKDYFQITSITDVISKMHNFIIIQLNQFPTIPLYIEFADKVMPLEYFNSLDTLIARMDQYLITQCLKEKAYNSLTINIFYNTFNGKEYLIKNQEITILCTDLEASVNGNIYYHKETKVSFKGLLNGQNLLCVFDNTYITSIKDSYCPLPLEYFDSKINKLKTLTTATISISIGYYNNDRSSTLTNGLYYKLVSLPNLDKQKSVIILNPYLTIDFDIGDRNMNNQQIFEYLAVNEINLDDMVCTLDEMFPFKVKYNNNFYCDVEGFEPEYSSSLTTKLKITYQNYSILTRFDYLQIIRNFEIFALKRYLKLDQDDEYNLEFRMSYNAMQNSLALHSPYLSCKLTCEYRNFDKVPLAVDSNTLKCNLKDQLSNFYFDLEYLTCDIAVSVYNYTFSDKVVLIKEPYLDALRTGFIVNIKISEKVIEEIYVTNSKFANEIYDYLDLSLSIVDQFNKPIYQSPCDKKITNLSYLNEKNILSNGLKCVISNDREILLSEDLTKLALANSKVSELEGENMNSHFDSKTIEFKFLLKINFALKIVDALGNEIIAKTQKEGEVLIITFSSEKVSGIITILFYYNIDTFRVEKTFTKDLTKYNSIENDLYNQILNDEGHLGSSGVETVELDESVLNELDKAFFEDGFNAYPKVIENSMAKLLNYTIQGSSIYYNQDIILSANNLYCYIIDNRLCNVKGYTKVNSFDMNLLSENAIQAEQTFPRIFEKSRSLLILDEFNKVSLKGSNFDCSDFKLAAYKSLLKNILFIETNIAFEIAPKETQVYVEVLCHNITTIITFETITISNDISLSYQKETINSESILAFKGNDIDALKARGKVILCVIDNGNDESDIIYTTGGFGVCKIPLYKTTRNKQIYMELKLDDIFLFSTYVYVNRMIEAQLLNDEVITPYEDIKVSLLTSIYHVEYLICKLKPQAKVLKIKVDNNGLFTFNLFNYISSFENTNLIYFDCFTFETRIPVNFKKFNFLKVISMPQVLSIYPLYTFKQEKNINTEYPITIYLKSNVNVALYSSYFKVSGEGEVVTTFINNDNLTISTKSKSSGHIQIYLSFKGFQLLDYKIPLYAKPTFSIQNSYIYPISPYLIYFDYTGDTIDLDFYCVFRNTNFKIIFSINKAYCKIDNMPKVFNFVEDRLSIYAGELNTEITGFILNWRNKVTEVDMVLYSNYIYDIKFNIGTEYIYDVLYLQISPVEKMFKCNAYNSDHICGEFFFENKGGEMLQNIQLFDKYLNLISDPIPVNINEVNTDIKMSTDSYYQAMENSYIVQHNFKQYDSIYCKINNKYSDNTFIDENFVYCKFKEYYQNQENINFYLEVYIKGLNFVSEAKSLTPINNNNASIEVFPKMLIIGFGYDISFVFDICLINKRYLIEFIYEDIFREWDYIYVEQSNITLDLNSLITKAELFGNISDKQSLYINFYEINNQELINLAKELSTSYQVAPFHSLYLPIYKLNIESQNVNYSTPLIKDRQYSIQINLPESLSKAYPKSLYCDNSTADGISLFKCFNNFNYQDNTATLVLKAITDSIRLYLDDYVLMSINFILINQADIISVQPDAILYSGKLRIYGNSLSTIQIKFENINALINKLSSSDKYAEFEIQNKDLNLNVPMIDEIVHSVDDGITWAYSGLNITFYTLKIVDYKPQNIYLRSHNRIEIMLNYLDNTLFNSIKVQTGNQDLAVIRDDASLIVDLMPFIYQPINKITINITTSLNNSFSKDISITIYDKNDITLKYLMLANNLLKLKFNSDISIYEFHSCNVNGEADGQIYFNKNDKFIICHLQKNLKFVSELTLISKWTEVNFSILDDNIPIEYGISIISIDYANITKDDTNYLIHIATDLEANMSYICNFKIKINIPINIKGRLNNNNQCVLPEKSYINISDRTDVYLTLNTDGYESNEVQFIIQQNLPKEVTFSPICQLLVSRTECESASINTAADFTFADIELYVENEKAFFILRKIVNARMVKYLRTMDLKVCTSLSCLYLTNDNLQIFAAYHFIYGDDILILFDLYNSNFLHTRELLSNSKQLKISLIVEGTSVKQANIENPFYNTGKFEDDKIKLFNKGDNILFENYFVVFNHPEGNAYNLIGLDPTLCNNINPLETKFFALIKNSSQYYFFLPYITVDKIILDTVGDNRLILYGNFIKSLNYNFQLITKSIIFKQDIVNISNNNYIIYDINDDINLSLFGLCIDYNVPITDNIVLVNNSTSKCLDVNSDVNLEINKQATVYSYEQVQETIMVTIADIVETRDYYCIDEVGGIIYKGKFSDGYLICEFLGSWVKELVFSVYEMWDVDLYLYKIQRQSLKFTNPDRFEDDMIIMDYYEVNLKALGPQDFMFDGKRNIIIIENDYKESALSITFNTKNSKQLSNELRYYPKYYKSSPEEVNLCFRSADYRTIDDLQLSFDSISYSIQSEYKVKYNLTTLNCFFLVKEKQYTFSNNTLLKEMNVIQSMLEKIDENSPARNLILNKYIPLAIKETQEDISCIILTSYGNFTITPELNQKQDQLVCPLSNINLKTFEEEFFEISIVYGNTFILHHFTEISLSKYNPITLDNLIISGLGLQLNSTLTYIGDKDTLELLDSLKSSSEDTINISYEKLRIGSYLTQFKLAESYISELKYNSENLEKEYFLFEIENLYELSLYADKTFQVNDKYGIIDILNQMNIELYCHDGTSYNKTKLTPADGVKQMNFFSCPFNDHISYLSLVAKWKTQYQPLSAKFFIDLDKPYYQITSLNNKIYSNLNNPVIFDIIGNTTAIENILCKFKSDSGDYKFSNLFSDTLRYCCFNTIIDKPVVLELIYNNDKSIYNQALLFEMGLSFETFLETDKVYPNVFFRSGIAFNINTSVGVGAIYLRDDDGIISECLRRDNLLGSYHCENNVQTTVNRTIYNFHYSYDKSFFNEYNFDVYIYTSNEILIYNDEMKMNITLYFNTNNVLFDNTDIYCYNEKYDFFNQLRSQARNKFTCDFTEAVDDIQIIYKKNDLLTPLSDKISLINYINGINEKDIVLTNEISSEDLFSDYSLEISLNYNLLKAIIGTRLLFIEIMNQHNSYLIKPCLISLDICTLTTYLPNLDDIEIKIISPFLLTLSKPIIKPVSKGLFVQPSGFQTTNSSCLIYDSFIAADSSNNEMIDEIKKFEEAFEDSNLINYLSISAIKNKNVGFYFEDESMILFPQKRVAIRFSLNDTTEIKTFGEYQLNALGPFRYEYICDEICLFNNYSGIHFMIKDFFNGNVLFEIDKPFCNLNKLINQLNAKLIKTIDKTIIEINYDLQSIGCLNLSQFKCILNNVTDQFLQTHLTSYYCEVRNSNSLYYLNLGYNIFNKIKIDQVLSAYDLISVEIIQPSYLKSDNKIIVKGTNLDKAGLLLKIYDGDMVIFEQPPGDASKAVELTFDFELADFYKGLYSLAIETSTGFILFKQELPYVSNFAYSYNLGFLNSTLNHISLYQNNIGKNSILIYNIQGFDLASTYTIRNGVNRITCTILYNFHYLKCQESQYEYLFLNGSYFIYKNEIPIDTVNINYAFKEDIQVITASDILINKSFNIDILSPNDTEFICEMGGMRILAEPVDGKYTCYGLICLNIGVESLLVLDRGIIAYQSEVNCFDDDIIILGIDHSYLTEGSNSLSITGQNLNDEVYVKVDNSLLDNIVINKNANSININAVNDMTYDISIYYKNDYNRIYAKLLKVKLEPKIELFESGIRLKTDNEAYIRFNITNTVNDEIYLDNQKVKKLFENIYEYTLDVAEQDDIFNKNIQVSFYSQNVNITIKPQFIIESISPSKLVQNKNNTLTLTLRTLENSLYFCLFDNKFLQRGVLHDNKLLCSIYPEINLNTINVKVFESETNSVSVNSFDLPISSEESITATKYVFYMLKDMNIINSAFHIGNSNQVDFLITYLNNTNTLNNDFSTRDVFNLYPIPDYSTISFDELLTTRSIDFIPIPTIEVIQPRKVLMGSIINLMVNNITLSTKISCLFQDDSGNSLTIDPSYISSNLIQCQSPALADYFHLDLLIEDKYTAINIDNNITILQNRYVISLSSSIISSYHDGLVTGVVNGFTDSEGYIYLKMFDIVFTADITQVFSDKFEIAFYFPQDLAIGSYKLYVSQYSSNQFIDTGFDFDVTVIDNLIINEYKPKLVKAEGNTIIDISGANFIPNLMCVFNLNFGTRITAGLNFIDQNNVQCVTPIAYDSYSLSIQSLDGLISSDMMNIEIYCNFNLIIDDILIESVLPKYIRLGEVIDIYIMLTKLTFLNCDEIKCKIFNLESQGVIDLFNNTIKCTTPALDR
jgi:hypothetical protein